MEIRWKSIFKFFFNFINILRVRLAVVGSEYPKKGPKTHVFTCYLSNGDYAFRFTAFGQRALEVATQMRINSVFKI